MKTLSKTHHAVVVAIVVSGTVMTLLVGPAGAQPYMGEVMTFASDFCPQGFLAADGRLLSIHQNQALFSLLGTSFGGDAQTTFALPDLRGATALGTGQEFLLPGIVLGQTGGTTTTVTAQRAIAKSVQVPATQSPSLSLTQCVSLFGVFPFP